METHRSDGGRSWEALPARQDSAPDLVIDDSLRDDQLLTDPIE